MKKPTAKRGKVRFSMWIDADMLSQLEQLRLPTGKDSVADVVRESVAVYTWLVKANQKGARLFYKSEDKGQLGPVWLLPGPPPFDLKGT